MASTKIPPRNVVNFLEIRRRCLPEEIPRFSQLQLSHKQYQERLDSLKTDLPQIDWEFYKRHVRTESVAMVEDFEKKYASIVIPYPQDKYTPQLNKKIRAQVEKEINEFIKKSNERIAAYEKQIEVIRSKMPFDQMTWEDYCLLYPESAPDFINRPTFWPHNDKEQIGYVEEEPILLPKQSLKSEKKGKQKKEKQEQKGPPKKGKTDKKKEKVEKKKLN